MPVLAHWPTGGSVNDLVYSTPSEGDDASVSQDLQLLPALRTNVVVSAVKVSQFSLILVDIVESEGLFVNASYMEAKQSVHRGIEMKTRSSLRC